MAEKRIKRVSGKKKRALKKKLSRKKAVTSRKKEATILNPTKSFKARLTTRKVTKKKKKKRSPKPKRKKTTRKRKPISRKGKTSQKRNRRTVNTKESIPKKSRTSYELNVEFEFFYELRDLILKSSPAQKDKMRDNIVKLGRIKLAVISGIFLDKESPDPMSADLLIVADDIDRRKLWSFLKALEAEVGKEIRFAIMDIEEFKYRLNMFDRFIRVLLEGPHERLIDKLGLDL